MAERFAELVDRLGHVPLTWVVGSTGVDGAYVNVGDALSPVVTAMVTGKPIRHSPAKATGRRMSAIGTIAQMLQGGEIEVWGTGSSPWAGTKPQQRVPWVLPPDTVMHLHATRGRFGRDRLAQGTPHEIPYGDPAWVLPRFHDTPVEKRWELGVVLHLAELTDRSFEPHPKPDRKRYEVPPSLANDVHLITMVGPPTLEGIRAKIDEVRACKRVISTSLHGLVIADCYGIPCFYVGNDEGRTGLARDPMQSDMTKGVNARFIDLFSGMGREEMIYWRQPIKRPTDWEALMRALDTEWVPGTCDTDALMQACPAGSAPVSAPAGGTIWDHEHLRQIDFVRTGRPRGKGIAGRAAGALHSWARGRLGLGAKSG